MLDGSSFLDRFESKFTKVSGCWIWNGTKNSQYGRFFFSGKTHLAHRVSYRLYRGDIPVGMEVCHSCDTPLCINPDHLWLGTQADNMRDMAAKKRSLLGERHHNSKFSVDDIVSIRALCECGLPQEEAAVRFGTSQGHISAIVSRRKWAHV